MVLKDLFNRNFFKFVVGFFAVILVSLLVIFAVDALMFSSGIDIKEDIPLNDCVTSTGDPC
jgi:hypothetical protein